MEQEKAKNQVNRNFSHWLSFALILMIIGYIGFQVIQWVEWRIHAPLIHDVSMELTNSSDNYRQYLIEIHYSDPDGDAFSLDWRILHTTIIGDTLHINDVTLNTTPDDSPRAGTTYSTDWTCTDGFEYSVDLQLVIVDSAGHESEPAYLTIDCHYS